MPSERSRPALSDDEWLAELIPIIWRYSEAPAPIGDNAWLELFGAIRTPLVEEPRPV